MLRVILLRYLMKTRSLPLAMLACLVSASAEVRPTGVSLSLAESAKKAVTRVCYSVFKKTSEDKLQLVASVVVSEAERGNFPTNIPYVSGDLIVYAYGMRDADAKATAKYGNYKVATGEDLASLIMTRKIKEKDYTLTETRGTTIFTDKMMLTSRTKEWYVSM